MYKQIDSDKASVPATAIKVYAYQDEEMVYLWQSVDRDWKIYDKQVSRFRFNWESA